MKREFIFQRRAVWKNKIKNKSEKKDDQTDDGFQSFNNAAIFAAVEIAD